MKFPTKLNQAGVAHLLAISVVGLALVGGVGYKVYATQEAKTLTATTLDASSATAAVSTDTAKKAKAYKAPASCAKKLLVVNGFSEDLVRFKSNHYVLPTDLTNYEKKDWVHSDGVTRSTYSGVGKVPVYNDGKIVMVDRVNYALVLQRHQGALGVLQARTDVNSGSYADSVVKLEAGIGSANAHLDNLATSWKTDGAGCATKAEVTKTNELYKARSNQLKELTKMRKSVEKASKEASRAYHKALKATSKADKAKAKAEKAKAKASAN